MKILRENIKTTAKLTNFVLEAHNRGCISSREAETITHSLNDHVRIFSTEMKKTCAGRSLSFDVSEVVSEDTWGEVAATKDGVASSSNGAVLGDDVEVEDTSPSSRRDQPVVDEIA